MTLTLPNELNEQILAKAEYLATDYDKLVVILLADGLAAQNERERVIATLMEEVAQSQPNEDGIHPSTDKLGEMIFGA